jgi:hypothetical protein|tara:strand:- start:105 stop:299 length:195 start_codon:yes stop_codon:yes gene_type:complete
MTLYEEINKKLTKEVESIKNSLAYGSASDYHTYMNCVGRIAGIEWANAEIKNITKKMLDEEDDD